ncbi:8-oxo-dGTP diphosphatase [Frondihabitans sp. PhB188]|nr:8-oxo-dGTP diphosphatase [Frondihabitans sp. PhB188]
MMMGAPAGGAGVGAPGPGGRPRQPLIAVDVVPAFFDAATGLHFGTAVRAADPAKGQLALPGVLLGEGERLREAAHRALEVKAGIAADAVRTLAQLHTFDEPGRESREHSVSVAYLAVVAPGPALASPADWKLASVRNLNLPFDHEAIIDFAREWMAARLWHDHGVTRALTGDTFTLAGASDLSAALTGSAPHTASLRRQLLAPASGVVQTDETVPARGTPSRVWAWR